MRQHLLQVFFILSAFILTPANAALINNQDVPENIVNYLHKKHPDAKDITVEERTHFGQPFFEVRFEENKTDGNNKTYTQKLVKLFHKNGHFFTNAYSVDHHAFNVMSVEAEQSLKSHYPAYKILDMRMISNPNGIGDEYEIDLLVSGNILNVTVNNLGDIISEIREQ